MGEWSDYFEDYPEENPANYVDGNFNPQAAAQKAKLANEQAALDGEIRLIIERAKHSKIEREKKSKRTP
jgi:hypothetical protein